MTTEERIFSHVNKTSGCWLWTASTSCGYGQMGIGKRMYRVHRLTYALAFGPIPNGFHVHHKCEVRRCVNPDHLELISPKEHAFLGENHCARAARKTHCPAGHPYSGGNLYLYARTGHRQCMACRTARNISYVRKSKQQKSRPEKG